MNLRLSACLVLSCLAAVPSARPQQATDAQPAISIWLPGKPWALGLNAPDFAVRRNEIQPDGRRYFLAENPKSRTTVSVFLEAGKASVTPEECKRSLEARAKGNGPITPKNVAFRESAGMQILEYNVAEVDGMPLNQRNLFACWGKENVFIDLHISKKFFKTADRALFDAILQSVRFVEKEATTDPVPVGSSLALFEEGSRYFQSQQYRDAIPQLQKALDIEKITPVLEKNLWRVLIDNLGMSYGSTRDLTRAKEILEYGVSKDPEFPMFYYNLACVAAEKGDRDDTESFLKLAFQYRNNMIPGEALPDPRVDDSFQRLLLEKEFRRFVDSLFGASR